MIFGSTSRIAARIAAETAGSGVSAWTAKRCKVPGRGTCASETNIVRMGFSRSPMYTEFFTTPTIS